MGIKKGGASLKAYHTPGAPSLPVSSSFIPMTILNIELLFLLIHARKPALPCPTVPSGLRHTPLHYPVPAAYPGQTVLVKTMEESRKKERHRKEKNTYMERQERAQMQRKNERKRKKEVAA